MASLIRLAGIMLKNITPLICAGCLAITPLLTGCVQTAEQANQQAAQQAAQKALLDEVRKELQLVTSNVAENTAQTGILHANESARDDIVQTQLQGMDESLAKLNRTIQTQCGRPQNPMTCSDPRPVIMAAEGKMLLGEIENIWVDPPGLNMIARIDTGASSSSLHAENITPFERDGDNYVRFDVGNDATTVTLERPVKKYVRVFQQADKDGSRRPVIELRLVVGDVQDSFSFTLADRSHLEHDMILGRNFLTDMAIVDVSQQFVQPPHPTDKP